MPLFATSVTILVIDLLYQVVMGRTRVIVAAAAVLFGVVLLATPSLAGPCSDVAGVYNFRWINFSPSCTRIYDHGSRFTIRADCSWDNIEGPEGYCKGTYNPTKGMNPPEQTP